MKNKKEIRKEFNEIDDKIIELLNERYNLSKEIGFIKKNNDLPIRDINRELQIISKISNYENSDYITTIYRDLFSQSRDIQNSDFLLIGKKLNYSHSKLIHNMLGNDKYTYYETDDFDKISKIPFKAINITNPYKFEAYKICDKLSEIASLTETVNTIIKYNGSNFGFNTDYNGFISMVKHFSINFHNKRVAILGNGRTKSTIALALESFDIAEYKVFARNPKENEKLIDKIYDYNPDIIINTTSYNVYPNLELTPLIDMSELTHVRIVIDVNYNPYRSILGLTPNIQYYNGLYMLIAQAEETENIIDFFYKRIRYAQSYQKIVDSILMKQRNIVLIGMPYAGKTTLARILGQTLNMPYYDSDEILLTENNSLNDVLARNETEEKYRLYENEVIKKLSTLTGSIISIGGGAINYSNNMTFLSQNGIIIYLDVPLNILKSRIDGTRPLIKTPQDIENIYDNRSSKYQEYADLVIKHTNLDETIKTIKEYLKHETSNY